MQTSIIPTSFSQAATLTYSSWTTSIIKRVCTSVFLVGFTAAYYHAGTHPEKAFPKSVIFYTNTLLLYLVKPKDSWNSKCAQNVLSQAFPLISQWSFSISTVLFQLPSLKLKKHNPSLPIFPIFCHLTASKACSHLLTLKEFPAVLVLPQVSYLASFLLQKGSQ